MQMEVAVVLLFLVSETKGKVSEYKGLQSLNVSEKGHNYRVQRGSGICFKYFPRNQGILWGQCIPGILGSAPGSNIQCP